MRLYDVFANEIREVIKIKRILNYPGSKWRLAEIIIDMIPQHVTYLEPFFGSGAVLFNKEPSEVEIINDLDKRVCNFLKCVEILQTN